MSHLFRKSYHPPGTAPGTLPEHDTAQGDARVHLVRYRGQEVLQQEDCDLTQCLPADEQGTLWCHLQGQPSPEQLARLGEMFSCTRSRSKTWVITASGRRPTSSTRACS
jgi:magnesium transporter